MLGRHGLELSQLRRFVAGADVFSRQADGTTIAGQYLREGIKLRPANMDRVNGWAEVLGWVMVVRKFCLVCSFTSGAGGWWRRCRRCSMIRIGRRTC